MVKHIMRLITCFLCIALSTMSCGMQRIGTKVSKIKGPTKTLPTTSRKPAPRPKKSPGTPSTRTGPSGGGGTTPSKSAVKSSTKVRKFKGTSQRKLREREAIAILLQQPHIGNELVADLTHGNTTVGQTLQDTITDAQKEEKRIVFIHHNAQETIKYIIDRFNQDQDNANKVALENDKAILQWKTIVYLDKTLLQFIILPDKSIMLLEPSRKDAKPLLIKTTPGYFEYYFGPSSPLDKIPTDMVQPMEGIQGKEALKKWLEVMETAEATKKIPYYERLLDRAINLEHDQDKQKQYSSLLKQIIERSVSPKELIAQWKELFAELEKYVISYEQKSAQEIGKKRFERLAVKNNLLKEISESNLLSSEEKASYKKILEQKDVSQTNIEKIRNALEEKKLAQETQLAEQARLKTEVEKILTEAQEQQLKAAEEAILAQANAQDAIKKVAEAQKNLEEAQLASELQKQEVKELQEQQNQLAEEQKDQHKLAKELEIAEEKAAQKIAAQQALEQALTEEMNAKIRAEEAAKKLNEALQETKALSDKAKMSEVSTPIKKQPSPDIPTKERPSQEEIIEFHLEAQQAEEARLKAEMQAKEVAAAAERLKKAKELLLEATEKEAQVKADAELATKNVATKKDAREKTEKDVTTKEQEREALQKLRAENEKRQEELAQQLPTAEQRLQAETEAAKEKEAQEIEQAKLQKALAEKTSAEQAAIQASEEALAKQQATEKALADAAAEQDRLERVAEQATTNLENQQKILNDLIKNQEQAELAAREKLNELISVKKEPVKEVDRAQQEKDIIERTQAQEKIEREKLEKLTAKETAQRAADLVGKGNGQVGQPQVPSVPLSVEKPPVEKPIDIPKVPSEPFKDVQEPAEDVEIPPTTEHLQAKPSEVSPAEQPQEERTKPEKPTQIIQEKVTGVRTPIEPFEYRSTMPHITTPEPERKPPFIPHIPRGTYTRPTPTPSYGRYTQSGRSESPYVPEPVLYQPTAETPPAPQLPRVPKPRPEDVELFETLPEKAETGLAARKSGKYLRDVLRQLKQLAQIRQKSASADESTQETPKKEPINPVWNFIKNIPTTIKEFVTGIVDYIGQLFNFS
ncbi:MAG TPA: hypothetical protein VJJ26_01450 [Candidatus Babeliales bacterium]|nr:hypothetical protein [Candidatus Babeliales bacterium]